MDLKLSGKFIAKLRKAKGLTQVKLAEILHVSEKTISKWECGNGFPDTSIILPLCEALDISANELLSGKRLNDDEYKNQAEENLIRLQGQQEKSHKFLLSTEWVLGTISSISFLIMIFVASFYEIALAWRIVLITFGFLQFLIGITFCLKIEKDVGFYQCAYCQNKYIPSFKQVLFSMHYGRTRFMKCPKCGRRTWNKKTYKE